MPVVVVDASAVAAILFGESAADGLVESLLRYELVSVALGTVRRGEVSVDAAVLALAVFSRMWIRLHERDVLQVFRVTARTRLTAYDAAHLWRARQAGGGLVQERGVTRRPPDRRTA